MSKPKVIEGQDLIYFPAAGRAISYFGELEKKPAERTRVLKQQHEWWQSRRGASRYATCQCNPGKALFYVREDDIRQEQRRYCLARFPRSGSLHDSGCFFHRYDVPRSRKEDCDSPTATRNGDLAPLFRSCSDPETIRTAVSVPKSNPAVSARRGQGVTRLSLRRLGTEILNRSGLCSWRPWFAGHRRFSQVDGLVAGAFQKLRADTANQYGQKLMDLGADVLVGSWTHVMRQARTGPATGALVFGFVTEIGPPTAAGTREVKFFSRNTPHLLATAPVIAKATKNPRILGPDCNLEHPVWLICVARKYKGQWKAHKIACFRLTRTGLIPVESDQEELMAEHLMTCNRQFRRLLLPPEPGCRFVPDFVLNDTSPRHFIEVAGRSDDNYLGRLEAKHARWAGRMTIWHAGQPLSQMELPPADLSVKPN